MKPQKKDDHMIQIYHDILFTMFYICLNELIFNKMKSRQLKTIFLNISAKKYYIFLILLFGVSNIASAQKTYFQTYFSGSNIYDVVECDSNFWYLTESKIVNENKLTKKITYYQLPDKGKIYDYKYHKFLKDSSGKLWIGGKGLYYLSNDKWIKHPKFNKPQTGISMFCSDPKGGIWFDDWGLYYLNGDSLHSYPFSASYTTNVSIFDKKNDLWFEEHNNSLLSNTNNGIYRFRDSFILKPIFRDTSWKSKEIYSAFFDNNNTLYLSGIAVKNKNSYDPSDFLIKYSNGVWTDIYAPLLDNLEPSRLRNILVESNGSKWITTRNFLLNFSSDTIKYHTLMRSYISVIKNISMERLFVGTRNPDYPVLGVGDGAWIFKNGKIIDSLKLGTGKFNTNEINCLSFDKDSSLWIAGSLDHISIKSKNGWYEHYDNNLSIPVMPDVILQKKDTMIVIGENGVHYWFDNEWHFLSMDIDGKKQAIIGDNGNVFLSAYYRDVCEVNLNYTNCFSNLKFTKNAPNAFDKPMCKDKNGRIWVGSGNFLYHTNDSGGWTKVNTTDWGWSELSDITRMNFDSKNHLWITTGKYNIYEFNGKYMVKHTPNYSKKTYPYYRGNTIITDSIGNIYIGCYEDGLYRYDGKNWFVYDTSNSGLLNNNINAIAIKSNGLWLGTDLGLVDFTNFGPGKLVSNTTDTVAQVNQFSNLVNIQLYPNPTNSTIHIEGLSIGNYKIVNYLGQTLSTGKLTNQINVEFLKPGIYSIIIENKIGQYQLKFIKE